MLFYLGWKHIKEKRSGELKNGLMESRTRGCENERDPIFIFFFAFFFFFFFFSR